MGLEAIGAHLSAPALLCALAGLGLAIGTLTGLFGVGGAFMIVPLLKVLLGVDYSLAVGSSLSYTIGAAAVGMKRHMRLQNVESRSMLILAGGAICGAVLGAALHDFLSHRLRASGPDRFAQLMHVLFILVLLLTAWMVSRGRREEMPGLSFLQRVRLGPKVRLPAAELEGVSLVGLCLVGLLVGLLTGMLGIGGGVLFVPVLIVVVGLSPHQAVGTSLGVVLFSSMAGTIKHGLLGNVNLWVVMALLAGSAVGVQIGVWLCQRMHGKQLRQWFAALVLLVAVLLACDLAVRLVRS